MTVSMPATARLHGGGIADVALHEFEARLPGGELGVLAQRVQAGVGVEHQVEHADVVAQFEQVRA